VDIAGIAHFLKPFEFLDPFEHGRPVGDHAAHPALGHVRHSAAIGFFLNGFLGLALGANKHDRAAGGDGVANQVIGRGERLDRLLQVNNVDAVPFGENERFHLGVPLVGAVTEMYAAFQQGFHRNN
jgi:hypothetical protein